jgi:hypothetical protein
VRYGGARLDGAVDDAVATDTEDLDELEGAVVDAGTGGGVQGLGRSAAVVRVVHGSSGLLMTRAVSERIATGGLGLNARGRITGNFY